MTTRPRRSWIARVGSARRASSRGSSRSNTVTWSQPRAATSRARVVFPTWRAPTMPTTGNLPRRDATSPRARSRGITDSVYIENSSRQAEFSIFWRLIRSREGIFVAERRGPVHGGHVDPMGTEANPPGTMEDADGGPGLRREWQRSRYDVVHPEARAHRCVGRCAVRSRSLVSIPD